MFSAYYKSLSPSDKHYYAKKLTLDSGIVLQIRNRDDVFVGGAYLVVCGRSLSGGLWAEPIWWFVGGAYLVAENDGFPVAVYGDME